MIKADKLPFHYSWAVVFACGVGMFVIFPLVFTVSGIYVVPITQELGITRTAYALSNTLQMLVSACAAFFLSRLLSRFTARKIMITAAFVAGVNLMSYSLIRSVGGLYIRAAITGFCTCLAGNIIMIILLQRWFVKNVNTAMSLAFTCSGLGGMVLSQVLSRVLVAYNWRVCYIVSGLAVLLLVVPTYVLLLRSEPADVGLRPYGAEQIEGVTVEAALEEDGVTLSQARSHAYFYFFLPAAMMVSMASGCGLNLAPSLYDSGYIITTVATIQSVYAILNSVMKLSVGVIFDKIGAKVGLFIVVMGYAVGYMALAFAHLNPVLGFAAGIGLGVGIAWVSLGLPFAISSIFGRKDYAAVFGFFSMATQMASAFSVTGAGLVYDIAGSYFPIWTVFSLGCVVAFGVFWVGLSRNFFGRSTT
jgi:MFS family permease